MNSAFGNDPRFAPPPARPPGCGPAAEGEEHGLIFWFPQAGARTAFGRFQVFVANYDGLQVNTSFGTAPGDEHGFFFMVSGPHDQLLRFGRDLEGRFADRTFPGGVFPRRGFGFDFPAAAAAGPAPGGPTPQPFDFVPPPLAVREHGHPTD